MKFSSSLARFIALVALVAPHAATAQTPAPARLTRADLARLRWIVGDWRGTGTAGTTQSAFYERYRFLDDSTLVVESFSDSTWRKMDDATRYELRGGRLGNAGTGARWVATRLDSVGVDFAPVARARNDFRWERAPRAGARPKEWLAIITPLGQNAGAPRRYLMQRVR